MLKMTFIVPLLLISNAQAGGRCPDYLERFADARRDASVSMDVGDARGAARRIVHWDRVGEANDHSDDGIGGVRFKCWIVIPGGIAVLAGIEAQVVAQLLGYVERLREHYQDEASTASLAAAGGALAAGLVFASHCMQD